MILRTFSIPQNFSSVPVFHEVFVIGPQITGLLDAEGTSIGLRFGSDSLSSCLRPCLDLVASFDLFPLVIRYSDNLSLRERCLTSVWVDQCRLEAIKVCTAPPNPL